MKVLLVEDDLDTIEALKTCIEFLYPAAKTIGTSHGLKAIDILKTDKFDIILMDLGLPDIDGLDLLKEIRTFSNTPVLVVSARQNAVDEARTLGANDYVTKPFRLGLIADRIAEMAV